MTDTIPRPGFPAPRPPLPRSPRRRSHGLARLAPGWPSLVVAFALALAVVACTPPAPTEHTGHGTAVDVDREARTITLDHGEIPGLMKGMTMTFAVAPDVDLAKVEKGAVVDFRVKSEGSAITVVGITPAPSAADSAAQP
jgi:Cu/Ag efflux protein CusF